MPPSVHILLFRRIYSKWLAVAVPFLNSFGMKAAFDGVDLFPPRKAAFIRSMAPTRIRVLGTVDPPDEDSAVESLVNQCEELKIDGLPARPQYSRLADG